MLTWLVQECEIEQQVSRLEDAVLMLQGCPYMLAAKGPLLHACRHRSAPQARVCPCLYIAYSFFMLCGTPLRHIVCGVWMLC